MNAERVIASLRELAALTATADGAQRLAWGPVWREAREWFKGQVAEIGLSVTTDSAGNNWVTLAGSTPKTVIVGSRLDSVPNGGWLDGPLGVLAALELDAHAELKAIDARAYLELHIEQGQPHLEKSIRAYLRLVEKTIAHVAAS